VEWGSTGLELYRLAHEKRLQRLTADKSALDAVCPRPQIDASRMACAISCSKRISCSFDPRGLFSISRSSASFCRVTPTRQGTHWPQVSSRKNLRDAQQNLFHVRSVVKRHDDARTECGADRSCPFESKRHIQFTRRNKRSSGAAQQNCLEPPASSSHSSRRDRSLRAASRQMEPRRRRGQTMCPEGRINAFRKIVRCLCARSPAPPSRIIPGIFTSVSTLFTTVG